MAYRGGTSLTEATQLSHRTGKILRGGRIVSKGWDTSHRTGKTASQGQCSVLYICHWDGTYFTKLAKLSGRGGASLTGAVELSHRRVYLPGTGQLSHEGRTAIPGAYSTEGLCSITSQGRQYS